MGHDQDPNFAAIDPAAMADLVTKLEGAARTIDEQAPGLKGRFESQGVATGNVTTIMQVASWVRDQLPMLRRRQSLAQAMVDGGFAYGAGSTWTFVDTGDNLGAFRTSEEARRAAGELAAKVKGDPTGHELPDDVFEQLLKYGSDPDFATEFYSQIGPEGISKLYVGAHRDRHLGDGPDPRKAMAVGISLATASTSTTPGSTAWGGARPPPPSSTSRRSCATATGTRTSSSGSGTGSSRAPPSPSTPSGPR